MQVARPISTFAPEQLPRRSGTVPRASVQARAGLAPRPAHRVPWLTLALCWALVVAGGLYYVHRQAELASLGFAMTSMRAEWDRLETENEELAAKVNQYKSISRIEAIATRPVAEGGLGMINPSALRVAYVDPDGPPSPGAPPAALATAAFTGDPAPGGFWQRLLSWATAVGLHPGSA